MKTTMYFKWSTHMMLQTVAMLLVFLGLAIYCYYLAETTCCTIYLIAVLILLVAILAALITMPRKIIVDKQDKLLKICLVGYSITVPFEQINSIQTIRKEENPTIQLCGTTGLFGYNGFYRTKSKENVLGFITDMSCVHIIRRRGKRPILVSMPNLSDILK